MLLTRSTYQRFHALLRRASIAASALPLLAGASTGAQATVTHTSTLVIEGAGNGHGVGMSQDGALGYAEHGWPYAAILGHYYTGTALSQASTNAVVKVLVGSKGKRIVIET